MPLSTAAAQELLDLIFLNLDWANVGDAGGIQGSATDGNLYVALHTADPGAGGDQTTNEIAYTGYSRVAVSRTNGFTRSGTNVSNAAAVTFGSCTGGSGTATHFSIGTASAGAGQIIVRGALNSNLAISAGITPEFAVGELDVDAVTT
jgi:hypothetical protein